MGDLRHLRGNKKFQGTGKNIFGYWTFYKLNNETGKEKVIGQGQVILEIKQKKFPNVFNQDEKMLREFLSFQPENELKNGQRFIFADFTFYAVFTEPEVQAA